MALWHLYRMETDPNVGPLSLSCADGENPIKFTLYDSVGQVYGTTVACVPADMTPTQILNNILHSAGYTPADWDE